MIFLEQTVNQILQEEGQVVLSLPDLDITWDKLEKLFIGTFEQCKGYISIYDWENQVLTNSSQKYDQYTHIRHITYNPSLFMQRLMPDVSGQYWEFNPYTKNASSLYNANFSLEVGKYPTCTQLIVPVEFKNVKAGTKIAFSLPFIFDTKISAKGMNGVNSKHLSLQATEYTNLEDTECKDYSYDPLVPDKCVCCDSNNGSSIILSGDDCSGSFDLDTLTGFITFNEDYEKINIDFMTKYVGIKELDLTCEIFYNWFKGNLLTMIGSIKKQIDMSGSGLPFDINQDDLLTRGREILAKVEELKGTKSHWSNF